MNCVQLVGNLGRDPELNHIGENNTAVCEFSIATKEYRSGKNLTEWHNVKCFGKQAEAANQYLVKGSRVGVVGRLSTRHWEKDGIKHYRTEVISDKLEFLNSKEEREALANSAGQDVDVPAAGNVEDMGAGDDLPF